MKAIVLPSDPDRILPFYLAAEEWAATCLPADEYFFAWQVPPTVICGRHQDMDLEVDTEYARERGIRVWRRKSGGGCVYADSHNIMFSYITPSRGVEVTFERYTSMICGMLHSLGINARPTGRNDVAVDGMKVAGNAFYRLPGRSIVHGTMLYDADFETMGRVLTPSRAKLSSKGVKSVPARVTTLKACGIRLGLDEFVRHAMSTLCTGGHIIPAIGDISRIDEIMQSYLAPEFLHPERRRMDVERRRRIEGVGEICVGIDTSRQVITGTRISGDFFQTGDTRIITSALTGIKMDYGELTQALAAINLPSIINGLTPGMLAEIILTETEQH